MDWIVVGSYFLALMVIGLYYRRFAGRSLEDYFLAGRRNSGWANGVSYSAALMNADVAPAYSGLTVVTGMFICWWYLTRFGLALFIGALLFAVFWRRLQLFTTPEFYELRFGGLASNIIRTWVAIRSSLIAMVAWTGTGLLAMYKIIVPILNLEGASPEAALRGKTITLLIVLPIVLVYVGIAGFSGVVATASIQSLIMLVGSVMLCGIVLYDIGGPAVLAERLAAVAGPETMQALPPDGHAIFPLAAAAIYLIGSSIGYGGDTAPLGGAMEGQYLLSSRNAREASKMYIVAVITLFILLLLVTLPALGALVQWPELRTGGLDREMAYGLLMTEYLPPGLLGLLFVVMLAAVMSTIGSNLNFGAQVLVNDVYRRYLSPGKRDRHYVWVGRGFTLLILALSLLVVYNVDLIFEVAIFMLAFSAAELPANWAQWWWWRFNRWGRLAASFGAPIILLLVRGISLPAAGWQLPGLARDWAWWNQTYLVIGLNTVFWVTVTLLTPPDSPAILARFYRKGRPLGAWGPIRRQAEGNDPDFQLALSPSPASHLRWILAGLGLAVLGWVAIVLMTLGLSHLYIGRYGLAMAELAGFVLGGVVFFASYGPFLTLLERWTEAPQSAPIAPVQAADAPSSEAPDTGSAQPAMIDSASQPAATSTVVAIATASYGFLIVLLGLVCTTGHDLALNAIAGVAFLLSASIVWRLGKGPHAEEQPAAAQKEDSVPSRRCV
ncbi:MAG: hypothetical protein AMXMBFR13_19620 [Phycisphaerae bacterium]